MKKIIYILFIVLSAGNFSLGQEIADTTAVENSEFSKKDKKISFAPVPYINYDRSIGFTVGGLPMIMYKINRKDTISPSSITGVLGMISTNGTWFGMAFSKNYFKEDKYRTVLAAGLGNINFQYYLNDFGYINYSTGMDFFFAEVQRRVIDNFYAGINFKYATLITTYDSEGFPDETSDLFGLGGVLSLDGRDDVYYPTKGTLANFNYTSFPEFMGNELISNNIEFDWNQFFGFKNDRDVLAVRGFVGVGIGDLDFNQQFGVGETDIRGYTQGLYRGDQKVAIQAEYRWNPFKTIGFVGFAGVATVFNGPNPEDDGTLLPAIGTGFRYNVFPENHMNVGMDVAVGKEDWGVYFRIGEAF